MPAFKNIFDYTAFLSREFISPTNYITAFLMGALINMGTGHGVFYYLTPYVVPIIVQAGARASVAFRHRDTALLLCLPEERKDPAFVVDNKGGIIASTGNSLAFFTNYRICSLDDLFDQQDVSKFFKVNDSDVQEQGVRTHEFFSETVKKWYQVQIKLDKRTGHTLVWMEDITRKKELDQRLAAVRRFSSEIIASIKEITKTRDIYERLSAMILREDYCGVFIARRDEPGSLAGHAFKIADGRLLKSELVRIPESSTAPILDSIKSKRIVSATRAPSEPQEAFDQVHPCDTKIRKFFGFPIQNFINYHEGEVSIIAFNKRNGIESRDLSMMETMVNTALSTIYLTDMAIANEEKFLQIITGLAVASEYSDEMTGKHILRVNEYSRLLAGHLGCDEEFSETIGQVAALHDIGKVAIPEIIKLQRKLTDAESRRMRMHPIYGAQIVEQMTALASRTDFRLIMARNIALNHHQQWNGRGYPGLADEEGYLVRLHGKKPEDYAGLQPLQGDRIPLEALIVSLADKYDALRSARQYKPAYSHEKTTAILLKDDRTGTTGEDLFGLEIIQRYLKIQDQFDAIYTRMQDSRTQRTV